MLSARSFRFLFWAALLFAFGMAALPQPPSLPAEPSDKVQHIIAFTTLTGLAVLAYPRAPLLRIGLLLSLFGGLIECVQTIPILYRDGSLLDWLADMAAIGLVLAVISLRRRRSLSQPGVSGSS